MRTFVIFFIKTSILFSIMTFSYCWASDVPEDPKIVTFPSGDLILGGELFLPKGDGPFPTVLFNHGSAPKMYNSIASSSIAPKFVEKGWAFFMPYRRGQGLSENQGSYILDEIDKARSSSGEPGKKLVELMLGDQLNDQLAAYEWLSMQLYVEKNRIATFGNSFGGIQVMLGSERIDYCAGVSASGAAQSWSISVELRKLLLNVAISTSVPIFFFQAENDYDLSASKELYSEMKEAGKEAKIKIYPNFGVSKKDGHSFPYKGIDIWFNDALEFIESYCVKKA